MRRTSKRRERPLISLCPRFCNRVVWGRERLRQTERLCMSEDQNQMDDRQEGCEGIHQLTAAAPPYRERHTQIQQIPSCSKMILSGGILPIFIKNCFHLPSRQTRGVDVLCAQTECNIMSLTVHALPNHKAHGGPHLFCGT
jgi:hypothetical protein